MREGARPCAPLSLPPGYTQQRKFENLAFTEEREDHKEVFPSRVRRSRSETVEDLYLIIYSSEAFATLCANPNFDFFLCVTYLTRS
jgi:hypothetical protein